MVLTIAQVFAMESTHFGRMLRAACDAYAARTGDSLTTIAERAGLHQTSLSRSFTREDAAPDTLRRVCAALGYRVAVVDSDGKVIA